MKKGIGPRGLGTSPLKQAKEVKVKDVPKLVADTAKDLVNKIGNIPLSTPEGQKRRAENKKKRLEQKSEKAKERLTEKWNKADAKTK